MRRCLIAAAVVALAAGASACGADDSRPANEKADALVTAARADDLAPNLTNDIARVLYGDDGGAVCRTLTDDQQPTVAGLGRLRVLGQPDEHADRLAAFDRLVVEIYCPGELERFDELLDDLHID